MTDCRFCLKKDTCKRNKANASGCRLYEQDNDAYNKYMEEIRINRINRREKYKDNPTMLQMFDLIDMLGEKKIK